MKETSTPEREPYYLSIDPGKITGYVVWNSVGQVLKQGQLNNDELVDFLEDDYLKPVKVVILEDYKLFSWKAKQQSGKRVPASEAIGIVFVFIKKGKRQEVRQPANILPIAEKLTNVKMPSTHSKSHWVSAFLHGAYYLIKQGIYETPLQAQTRKKNDG